MLKSFAFFAWTSLTLGLATLPGCVPHHHDDTEVPAEAMVLRAYDVPSQFTPELVEVLDRLMYRGKNAPVIGDASTTPSGGLLVTAPASFHEGVAELVETVRNTPPAPPPTVTLDYSLVLGAPAPSSDGRDGIPSPLHSTLDALEKVNGTMRWAMLDSVSVRSLSGNRAEAGSDIAVIEQTATFYGDAVLANVGIRTSTSHMRTQVQVPLGKTVVLGRTGYQGKVPGEPSRDVPGQTVFFIIRASVDGR